MVRLRFSSFCYSLPLDPVRASPPNDPSPIGPDHALPVMAKYLNDRAGSIYAGSNEIQRNIMAKGILGL